MVIAAIFAEITAEGFLAVIGAVGSVIGIPLTWYLARRSRQRPDVRYAVDHDRLIDPGDTLFKVGLTLGFAGGEISRVSRTYFAVWNRRGDTVRGADVVTADPVRLSFAEGDVPLQATLICCSRAQTNVRCRPEGTSVLVDFDFLDEGDGAIIEVLHTGKEAPGVKGTIRGSQWREDRSPWNFDASELSARSQGWRATLRYRWKKNRRRWLPFALVTTVMFGAMGYLLVQTLDGLLHPRLVNVGAYNLATFEGQASFAREVMREGKQSVAAWLTMLAGFLSLVGAYLLRSQSARVPRSILHDDLRNTVDSSVESDPSAVRRGGL